MRRRELITFIGGAAVWPLAALAQTPRVFRVGTLTPGLPIVAQAGPGAILFNALAKRGYVLGQNLVIESRAAVGKVDLVPQMMQELKAANNRKRVIGYAAEHRLPAIYEADSIVRDGGLMSYGADTHRQASRYRDRRRRHADTE